jgi:hypothetical protein
MGNWKDMTLADLAKSFARYRPFVAVVAAGVLVVGVLPGEQAPDSTVSANKLATTGGSGISTPSDGSEAAGTDAATTDTAVDAGATVDAGAGAAGATGGTATAPKAGSTAPKAGASTPTAGGGTATGTNAVAVAEGVGPDCDTSTGRIRTISRAAPPCKPIVPQSQNGGATSFGVSGDTISIVWYRPKADPAVTAALTAAGASDQDADVDTTIKVYIDYLNKHYNLYGRQFDMHIVNGSADAKDDAAGIRDAIALADKYKPFAVINNINNAFVDELVARKIICICTTSLPNEFYEQRFPYAGWTTLMSSTQGYIMRAEYVGKRLNGRNAKWAGYRNSPADPMNDEQRVFGLLWYNTPDGLYKVGADFFEKELARYNTKLKVSLGYPSDLAAAQEQTRSLISRLKAEGVTSVIFAGDPVTPATFTQEAANQQWQPEWIITGSALTDTSLFGRTYNKDQWSRAFGISFLSLRAPQEQTDAYRIHVWHGGSKPNAKNTYGVLYAPFFTLGTAVHMAGPKLTPESFAQGLFSYPVTNQGSVTGPTISWGRHGIWDKEPWKLIDLMAYDDVTEIWWDNNAVGPDEVGNNGPGMYRYVDGGKRYLPGSQPTSDPRVFDAKDAPTILTEFPANEKSPDYEHKHYYTKD